MVAFLISYVVNAQQAGMLNNQFSQDGWDASIYGNNSDFEIKKTIIQSDGKLLICAEAKLTDDGYQAVLIRYNTDGTIDTTFGAGDGIVRSKEDVLLNLYCRAVGMILQNDGKILIAGENLNNTERIFRLNSDGSIDLTFGINGIVDMPRPNGERINHIAVQSDNKIVVSGKEKRIINGILTPQIFLWRFTENGNLDSSFGLNGVVGYNFVLWSGVGENYLKDNDLLILADNKIVVNQTFAGIGGYSVLFKKFNSDGSPDYNFGINGNAVRTEYFEDGISRYSSSSLQQDGSIVFSFTSFEEETNYSESIFRLSAEGIFDHSLHIELENYSLNPDPVKVISNGNKIYVIKRENAAISSFNKIHCYDLFGNIRPTFGENGIGLINQNNIPIGNKTEAIISEDGNIYLSSHVADSTSSDISMFLISNIIGFDANLSVKQTSTNDIVLAPNPTSGLVNIFNSNNLCIDKIEVVDILGKAISINPGEIETLDFSNYSSGVYIVKLYCGHSVIEKKIAKK